MAKNNIRSFRFSDEVFNILENSPGKCLSEKFDNLVYYSNLKIPETEKELARLNAQVEEKRKQLSNLQDEINRIDVVMSQLRRIKMSVFELSQYARQLGNSISNTEEAPAQDAAVI